MSGERIDYGIERQRHAGFVGRVALLRRLDQLLVADGIDCRVVVTGGPGMGKTALLTAWLIQREAAGAVVPHHFIRRDEYNRDDPATLVGSLVAQLEARYPDQHEPDEDAQLPPAARLTAMLARVSTSELGPRGERLVILIDGLDEYDPPAGPPPGDPLAAFLPGPLPRGVSILCAIQARHPYLAMLETRADEQVQIDLDDPASAADNAATVRAFWEQAAPALGLAAAFIDEACARADDNMLHAVTWRNHLASLPASQRGGERIPRGLEALFVRLWGRIATDPISVRGVGILCAAREALTLDELGRVAGWAGGTPQQAFVRGAGGLLEEARREDRSPAYRLPHEAIRARIAALLGPAVLRDHHAALIQHLATWPPLEDAAARRYALRHALTHRAEAGDWVDAFRIAFDVGFLEAKCRELGVDEAAADVARLAQRCHASGQVPLDRLCADLARALVRESRWLRAAPEAITALLWNRLQRAGWSNDDLDFRLQVPAEAMFLRMRYEATRGSPDFAGHTDPVTACVVMPDDRRAVSASMDRTLKLWDLYTGRVLASFPGHTSGVTACTVTPDGQHLISASQDRMMKVWDLGSRRLLASFPGHAGWVTACAVTPDGRRMISASEDRTLRVWDLVGHLATLEGHTDGVLACAVTPDGKRVISASMDRTLKLWDLDTARALATFVGHAGHVTACAVTPDGQRMVSASQDGTLKIWDLEGGLLLGTLDGHRGRVTACAVTPSGRLVVSASEDRTLKLWGLETHACFLTHRGDAAYTAVAATATTVVAGDVAGTLAVLNWPPSMRPPDIRMPAPASIHEYPGGGPRSGFESASKDTYLERSVDVSNQDHHSADRHRTVDLQLERVGGDASRWIPATTTLAHGQHYDLRVAIGAPLPGSLLDKPPPGIDDLLPPERSGIHELEVAVFGLGLRVVGPAVQPVTLPKAGPSTPAVFTLEAEREGEVHARVIVYARNQALQAFRISAHAGVAEARGEAPVLGAKLEFSRTVDFDRLDRFAPRLASFAVNASTPGTHSFLVKGRGGAASVASVGAPELAELTRALRRELDRATQEIKRQLDDGIADDPASESFRRTFQALAHHGQDLYYALAARVARQPTDPGTLQAIASSAGETIQVMRFDLDFAFPWPVLYDLELPHLVLGRDRRPVPPEKICLGGPSCDHVATRTGYCVRGFWGIRHVVEELFADGSQDDAGEVVAPGPGRGIHVALGFVDTFARAIEAEAARVIGPAARSLAPGTRSVLEALWDDRQRPAQLIVYSHLETKDLPGEPPGRRVLFMTGADREFLLADDLRQRWRRAGFAPWRQPRTVVFLMTCSSLTDEDLLSDFGKSFHVAGAAAVVGVEVPVFEALVSQFACQVTRAWWAGAPLGEAIRGFRHQLMVAGNPLGFVFNVLGNADLRVR
jgi:hypothetical protein